jgi:predicted homoserine dehydrogenase-like protein
MAEKVRVALIGGGRTGTPLLKSLMKYPFVDVVGVADKNDKAQSIKIAERKGIFTTTKPMDLVNHSADTDILIEVTGDSRLKSRIKSQLKKNGNKHTIIMHNLVARLLMSVCTGRKSLAPSFHPQDVGVGR